MKTNIPSQNVNVQLTRKPQDKIDLGFLQVLSDSDDDENDANDNEVHDAGFMALLSDSDSEDETNNNENHKHAGKQEKGLGDETIKAHEASQDNAPQLVPDVAKNNVIDVLSEENGVSEPMNTLLRPRYDVEEDTRRPYNRWITDVSLGAGWKLKRKGNGIVYKDKKGSIYKSRFRALNHYISSRNLKSNKLD